MTGPNREGRSIEEVFTRNASLSNKIAICSNNEVDIVDDGYSSIL